MPSLQSFSRLFVPWTFTLCCYSYSLEKCVVVSTRDRELEPIVGVNPPSSECQELPQSTEPWERTTKWRWASPVPARPKAPSLLMMNTSYHLRLVELKTSDEMFNDYFVAIVTRGSPYFSRILFLKKALNIINWMFPATFLASNYFPLYYIEYKIVFPLNADLAGSSHILHSSSFIPPATTKL